MKGVLMAGLYPNLIQVLPWGKGHQAPASLPSPCLTQPTHVFLHPCR